MNLVDSCGWLEYFSGGSNVDFFTPPLEASKDSLLVPVICLYEVFKIILKHSGREEAVSKVAAMRQGIVVSVDESLAIDAALISNEFKIPMADSIILATARKFDAVLWTQDKHFEGIRGVRFHKKKP